MRGAVVMLVAVTLTAMQFLPVIFVHPVRVRRWRGFTMSVLALWCLAAASTLLQGLKPDFITQIGLLIGAVYFLGLGLLRQKPDLASS